VSEREKERRATLRTRKRHEDQTVKGGQAGMKDEGVYGWMVVGVAL
jgi:hypothetical protein